MRYGKICVINFTLADFTFVWQIGRMASRHALSQHQLKQKQKQKQNKEKENMVKPYQGLQSQGHIKRSTVVASLMLVAGLDVKIIQR